MLSEEDSLKKKGVREFWKVWWDFLGTGMRMDIPRWKGGAPEEGPSM